MGISQVELAARLGIKQTTISQYERGRAKPSVKQIINLLSLDGGQQYRAHPAEYLPLMAFLEEELGVEFTAIALIDIDLANIRAEEAKIRAKREAIQAMLNELDEQEKLLLYSKNRPANPVVEVKSE